MFPLESVQQSARNHGWGVKEEGNRIKIYNHDNSVFVIVNIDGMNYSTSVEIQSDLTTNTVIEPARFLNDRNVISVIDALLQKYRNYSSDSMFSRMTQ